ncbi:hypothetical protein C1645_759395 [Glomus cerebriforme]|uniref:Membrane anchor Opy2 N-terminal domain-containing protein n=1 Tax=Glomus cerebriforme TaxID=658196 RepID=A0A397TE00_9GLOM|nr:hypothetical protein C1645_759395 [Glomus cerebriforme]
MCILVFILIKTCNTLDNECVICAQYIPTCDPPCENGECIVTKQDCYSCPKAYCQSSGCIQCFTYPICHKCADDEICVIVEPDCNSCGSANCVKKSVTPSNPSTTSITSTPPSNPPSTPSSLIPTLSIQSTLPDTSPTTSSTIPSKDINMRYIYSFLVILLVL